MPTTFKRHNVIEEFKFATGDVEFTGDVKVFPNYFKGLEYVAKIRHKHLENQNVEVEDIVNGIRIVNKHNGSCITYKVVLY